MVRDGQIRRIQDYELDDPVILVWDNDIFLAYEKALYLKTIDNDAKQISATKNRIAELG